MQDPGTPAPYLSRIAIFPVKALDGVEVPAAEVLATGALADDRRYAIFDEFGKYVNGKRNAKVHLLRSSYAPLSRSLSLAAGPDSPPESFDVESEREPLERWLAAFFGFPVTFRENTDAGFPDDTESPGPTIIATATLQAIGDLFGFSLEQARARFRTNLEVGGVPAFWEDRLYGRAGTAVRFSVGGVEFDGINPCQRCVVPTRDPLTGKDDPNFAKRFVEFRRKYLPEWAESSRFNHYYRVAINTRLAEAGPGVVALGDPINVIGPWGVPAAPAPVAAAPARPAKWSGTLRVDRVYDNTPTVRTFRLAPVGGGTLPFTYLPGQFLNIELTIDGVRHRRCYTIASPPTRAGYCELTVKRDEKGTVSRHLHDNIREGALIEVSGPGGRFTFTENDGDSIVLIGGGVGITPLMSKLRYLTDKKWAGAIHLLYSVRTEEDIIFREELASLEGAFPNVKVTTTLTHEPGSAWTGPRGFINAELLRQAMDGSTMKPVHLCGPTQMAEAMTRMLRDMGVPAEQIHSEAFGGPAVAPALKPGEEGGAVVGSVTFADSGTSKAAREGQTILEISTLAGLAIDRGCLAGICGRCKVRLLSGEVTQGTDEALSDAEREKGFILSCQAKPVGNVAVDA